MTFFFAVKRKVAGYKHSIRQVAFGEIRKDGFVNYFRFGKAFLLIAHEAVIRFTVRAERVFIIMGIGNHKEF